MSEFGDAALRGDIINHTEASDWMEPEEDAVREKLEWFRDQKLALMVHWGIYSELGICESWPLSDEDAPWSREEVDWIQGGDAFRREYWSLAGSFNPVRFEPERWADFAAANGFRYLIFTTKHHDGFCMYDSRLDDYKVTSPKVPFSSHRYADIARHLFDAFRAKGLGIAAYFSKPDWHCPWYWAEGQEKPVGFWRHPTYHPDRHPEIWERFVRMTQGQMLELVKDYGPLDILWLDGGWVNPRSFHQDIRLEEVAREARAVTPGLLIADRTVGGRFENYITPEQQVPDHYIPVPWESCITIGRPFSYSYEDELKSARTLVHLLVDVVAKGGNMALNIGAQPDGRLPVRAMKRAGELGAWLRENGEAIYGTRALPPYFDGDWSFTRGKKAGYAILRLREGERLPGGMTIPVSGARRVSLMGRAEALETEQTDGGVKVRLPGDIVGTSPLAPVFVLEGLAQGE